jgi:hypothetical protein
MYITASPILADMTLSRFTPGFGVHMPRRVYIETLPTDVGLSKDERRGLMMHRILFLISSPPEGGFEPLTDCIRLVVRPRRPLEWHDGAMCRQDRSSKGASSSSQASRMGIINNHRQWCRCEGRYCVWLNSQRYGCSSAGTRGEHNEGPHCDSSVALHRLHRP